MVEWKQNENRPWSHTNLDLNPHIGHLLEKFIPLFLFLVSSMFYWHFVKIWNSSKSKNLGFNKGELEFQLSSL